MKQIKLTKGYKVTVDDVDFEYLNQFKWLYNNGYAARAIYPELAVFGQFARLKDE